MKKKCVIISDSQEYDIDLINNLIEKSEFEYEITAILTLYEINYKKFQISESIKAYSVKELIDNYQSNFKNIIEIDEKIFKKYALIEHQHNKALTFVTPNNNFNLNEIREEYFKNLKFGINFIEEYKPDLLFFLNIPHEHSTVTLQNIAIIDNIPQVVLRETLPSCFVLEDPNKNIFKLNSPFLKKEKKLDIIQNFLRPDKKAINLYSKFRNHNLVKNQIFTKNFFFSFSIFYIYRIFFYFLEQTKNIIKLIIYETNKKIKFNNKLKITNPMQNYENWKKKNKKLSKSKSSQFNYTNVLFIEDLKKFSFYRNYLKLSEKVSESEKFIYFPLHFQPEATTMPYGNFYFDQINAVRVLSSCIKDDIKIYVKEHPDTFNLDRTAWSRGLFSKHIDYYNDLSNIKKVKIIDINTSNNLLLKNSLFVATIAGTSAIQAALYKKNSLVFGDAWFKHCEGILSVRNTKEIKEFLNQKKYNCEINIKKIEYFFDILNANSCEWSKTRIIKRVDRHIGELTSLIIKRLSEINNKSV